MYARKIFKFVKYAKEAILLVSYIFRTIGGAYPPIRGMEGSISSPNFGQKGLLLSQRAKK